MNHNANGVVSGTGDGGGRASIAERRAAKCGFNAERINTARFRTTSPLASPVVGSPPCLTIPPGISPTALLDSPILLPNSQGADMNSQDLSLVEPPIIFEFPVQLSKAIANCSARDSVTDVKDINNMIENDSCCDLQLCRSDVSSSETSLLKAPIQGEDVEMHHLLEGEQKGTNLPVVTARTSEDGYNWRKYGQKQVKCSEYPRSYYKCTYPNCLVKKKVECSHDGQITEIIYNGAHSHQKPQPSCQASLGSAFPLEEMSEIGEDGITCVKIEGGSVWTNIQKGSKNVQLGSDWSADVLERTSSTSGVTEVSDPLSTAQGKSVRVFQAVETPEFPLASHGDDNDDDGATQGSMSVGDDADDDESESKRRRIESSMIETNLTSRAVREPRVVVQIESEVDILDDGYRWRKYGQKVVKGNPNPRSYYKCTSPGCSVRKHVERASHNLKYVITTYEGKHNHEVPAARNSSHVNLSGSDVPPEVANAQSTLTLPQTTRGQKPETGIQNITPCFDRKPEFNSEYLRPGVPWSSMYQMNFPLLQNMVPFFGLNSNCTGAQHPGSIASFPDFHISMPSNFSTNMNLSLGGMTFNNNGNIIDPVQPFLLGQQLKDDKMRLLRPKEEQKDENVYDACIPIIDHANPASALSSYHQVVFTGGRTQPGTTKPDEGERHPYSIIDCEPKREVIIPSVIYIQKILRRRPFLIKNLENVMRRFLQSLELFEENERKKLAIFTALAFSQKLSGLPPETVFQPLLKDNLVAKGLVLSFMTDFFKEYLIDNSLDDLISILKRGKMEDNLLDIFPSGKRSAEGFAEHFTKEGLIPLVEYNEKKIFEVKLKEMKSALTTQIAEETDISEVIETVKQRVKDAKLPDIEIVRILWDVLMDAVQWSGKNQQQNANAALRQVKTWANLLNTFCTNGRLELELLYKVQMQCYEDAKLMKLFPEIVRSLYDQDVLAEDTILHWFRKGTNPKGRQTFVKALEPFVNWLEEAEEEE